MRKRKSDTPVVVYKRSDGAWVGNMELGVPGGLQGSFPIEIVPGSRFGKITFAMLERAAASSSPPATQLVLGLESGSIGVVGDDGSAQSERPAAE